MEKQASAELPDMKGPAQMTDEAMRYVNEHGIPLQAAKAVWKLEKLFAKADDSALFSAIVMLDGKGFFDEARFDACAEKGQGRK
jgi:hypothetical protein